MRLPFLFVLLTLAAYRCTRIITSDTLPFLRWGRDKLMTRWEKQGKKGLAKIDGLTCPWCAGWWVSLVVVAVTDRWFAHLPLPVLWGLAVSCGVGLIGANLDKD